jgi:hypothetical protein
MLNELRQHIIADPAVEQLIGSRMYPVTLPQAVELPAVTYQVISATRTPTMLHGDNLPSKRIQIDAYSLDSSEAQAVVDAIREVFQFFVRGTIGDSPGIFVAGVFADTEQQLYEPDTKLYRVSIEFRISHAE